MINKGKLFLIPNLIAENTQDIAVSLQTLKVLPGIHHFLAEDIRTARRFLSSLKIYPTIETLQFSVLDKSTKTQEIDALFTPVFNGFDMGVISESGCPGVADPGALAVKFAHKNEIRVVPLIGPSAILMALMASGLNGQQFAFHGYLPIEAKAAGRTIKELEQESRRKNQTQIFIETPYRNNNMLKHLTTNLTPGTQLCLALDITGPSELVITQTVNRWKDRIPELPRKPAVFLFLA